jgi:hypothetical protein
VQLLGLGHARAWDCQHWKSFSLPTHNFYLGRAKGSQPADFLFLLDFLQFEYHMPSCSFLGIYFAWICGLVSDIHLGKILSHIASFYVFVSFFFLSVYVLMPFVLVPLFLEFSEKTFGFFTFSFRNFYLYNLKLRDFFLSLVQSTNKPSTTFFISALGFLLSLATLFLNNFFRSFLPALILSR